MGRGLLKKLALYGVMLFAFSSYNAMAQDSAPAANPPTEVNSQTIIFGAQNEGEDIPPELLVLKLVDSELQEIYKRDSFVPPNFPSLFFLPGEHRALKTALASFVARPPTEEEIAESEASSQGLGGDDLQGEGAQKTYPREVKLGGILYNGVEDWIIWINQTRITPGAIPSEILDISVYDNYVELKWFDGETNKIYPIRLRPNQRFNIDARMFLPG